MNGPAQRREALALYLEAASRLQNDTGLQEAREARALAAGALTAAEAALARALEDRASVLADLRAAVECGREAGLRDPDPLGLLEDLEPPPDPEPLVLQEEPDLTVPETEEERRRREFWNRSAPGVSLERAYRALRPEPADVETITRRAGGGGPGKGGSIASALVHLHDLGLAVRSQRPRIGRSAPRSTYRLAGDRHLDLDRQDLLGLQSLRRTGRVEEALAQVERLRAASATTPVPEPEPHPAITPDPPPPPAPNVRARRRRVAPYREGDVVRVYDPEKHHYRPGTVEALVIKGSRRGDVRVRLAGANRVVQAGPDQVKPLTQEAAAALAQ